MSHMRTGVKLALCFAMVQAACVAPASGQSGQVGTAVNQPGTMPATPGPATQGGITPPRATPGGAPSPKQGQPSTGRAVNTTPHVLVLVPVDLSIRENSTKSGCWAKIYDGENYMGDTLTLAGPIELADMDGPFGLDWDDKVNSVELGPKATMTVFDNEAFRDPVAQFKSGQKVPNISRKLGMFDEFESVRISCTK